ncbi:MAG TPA: DNA polymerase III subunit alpha [Rubrobacteraceae bacterium]|nr:DNA polymerase III subunit alpha [Rubrobacteraceae bacterium]
MAARGGSGLSSGFVHLHVRSGHSYGFGVATPEELVAAAAKAGAERLALTDRDGLYGVPRFLRAAGEAGVSPIVGAEVSVVDPGACPRRQGGGHLVLLAESMGGYRSLCGLLTAYRCGSAERRRPACGLDLLPGHAGGLVCLTGALPFGLLPRLVLGGRGREAGDILRRLREVFGVENVFVEVTDDRTAGSGRRLAEVVRFAEAHGAPVLATGEVAYLRPQDHRLHEVIVAAANLTRLPGPGYRPTDQLYLGSPERMERLFASRPEALENARTVAERCAGAARLAGGLHMPAAGSERPEKQLIRLAVAGARRRYGRGAEEKVRRRLRRELECICSLGFAPYFLLAHEAREIAVRKGVSVTGRGSAANSLVSYCLGLTDPEPFENRLLFERFLHEGRRDPPDIDLDLDSERRDEVRDELVRRHERHGAAVAATASTLSLRGAVRVAARALGHPPGEINRLCRHVPTRFRDRDRLLNPLSGWREALLEPAMKGHPLQDRKRYSLLLDLSWRLLGRLHGTGTHLGGLVFGNEARHLSALVPLEPSGIPGLLRCQFDKDGLEYAGLPKLDLLGLKMHTALRKAGELATRRFKERVNPLSPPPEDAQTYALIRTGRNVGMFQLESPGQMHLSVRLGPRRLRDLVAQISLFRPGPVRGDLVTPYVLRKNGLEPHSIPLPELEEVLKPTYGVLIFQEQVLEVAHAVAGFTLAEGDLLRRAMTKSRGPGAMDEFRGEFLRRAAIRGVPKERAQEVFAWMEGFSVYGFSAAHAASFAHLSYASAYMRTHYPAEFFCGLLDSQPMGFYSPRVLLNEARRTGLETLPPDVHLSGEGFTVEGDALRVGLSYCRGLSRKALASIVSARKERPFASVADLYRRTAVQKDSLEALIRGGFLDALEDGGRDGNRSRLLGEAANLPGKRRHARQPEIPLPHPASWWEKRERRITGYLPPTESARERMEWEVLSLNVHRHPLAPYRDALADLGVTPSGEIRNLPHGSRVRAAGLFECLQCPPTRSGRPVWFLLVEDEGGLLQATVFERVYDRYGDLLHHRGAFLLDGRVEQDRRRGFSFLIERAYDLREALVASDGIPTPRAVPGSFLRAGRRGRRRAG